MASELDGAWEHLGLHPDPTLAQLFDEDPSRVARFSGRIELGGNSILFDWSKTHLTVELLDDFERLAEAADFAGMRDALFRGETVNVTEGRAATHTAERGVGSEAQVEESAVLHRRMKALVEAIHQGALGEVKHLIHVGIGGSALGPPTSSTSTAGTGIASSARNTRWRWSRPSPHAIPKPR